jgi:hypothetical protein
MILIDDAYGVIVGTSSIRWHARGIAVVLSVPRISVYCTTYVVVVYIADVNAALNIRDRWVSKSSRGLITHRQGVVDHPHGNGENTESQDHHASDG